MISAALLCSVLVTGTSMQPLLHKGRTYAFQLVQDTTAIGRGDLVVFGNGSHRVKRVAALPGDTLAHWGLAGPGLPEVLPAGGYFLDSPRGSSSRRFGVVHRDSIRAIRRK